MTKLLTLASAVAFSLFVSGCATTTEMALQNNTDRVTDTSNPIYLMTATLKNSYKTAYQPELNYVNVEKVDEKDGSDEITFAIDELARNVADSIPQGNSYLLRMELPAGSYEIVGLTSMGRSFPFIGTYFAPLHSPLNASRAGIFYLGHVTATVRERQGTEFKAGPSTPLIDQAVIGASGGTFDIAISDEHATDEKLFRAKFPALEGVDIEKAILPPFDRAKAQQWWEEH